MSDRIATLREYLLTPPNGWLWDRIVELFSGWPPEQERDVGIEYANAHVNAWSDELRILYEFLPQHPCWPLARRLYLNHKSIHHIESLHQHPHITGLNISHCPIRNVDQLATARQLEWLDMRGCEWLENVDGLLPLHRLTFLDLSQCPMLNGHNRERQMTSREEIAAFQRTLRK